MTLESQQAVPHHDYLCCLYNTQLSAPLRARNLHSTLNAFIPLCMSFSINLQGICDNLGVSTYKRNIANIMTFFKKIHQKTKETCGHTKVQQRRKAADTNFISSIAVNILYPLILQ